MQSVKQERKIVYKKTSLPFFTSWLQNQIAPSYLCYLFLFDLCNQDTFWKTLSQKHHRLLPEFFYLLGSYRVHVMFPLQNGKKFVKQSFGLSQKILILQGVNFFEGDQGIFGENEKFHNDSTKNNCS